MSVWTDIIDDLADHVSLLKELGLRSVPVDPDTWSAFSASPAAARPLAPAVTPPPAPAQPRAAAGLGQHSAPLSKNALSPEARRTALDVIAQRIDACTACVLRQQRNKSVPGQGNPDSPDIMFIGEAPGGDEDRQGLAFVGEAGQLLTRMIAAMGYSRDAVFIANICKCRPPSNRTPQPDEMQACLHFLREQISIVRPKVIVLLGGTAIKAILDTQVGVNRVQGQWTTYEGIPVMPTFHPSYLLRFPPAKKDAWTALKRVLAHLGKTVPAPAQ